MASPGKILIAMGFALLIVLAFQLIPRGQVDQEKNSEWSALDLNAPNDQQPVDHSTATALPERSQLLSPNSVVIQNPHIPGSNRQELPARTTQSIPQQITPQMAQQMHMPEMMAEASYETIQQNFDPAVQPAAPVALMGPEVLDEPIIIDNHSNGDSSSYNYQLTPVIQQRVAQQTGYGQTLARRGATHAARDEFVAALRLVAESLDQQNGTRNFTDLLYRAFTAVDEADDFVNQTSETYGLKITEICRGHRTNILDIESTRTMTPQRAMQAYYSYAERCLLDACGKQAVAAAPFYSLGKSFAVGPESDSSGAGLNLPKSMIMFRLAIAVNPSDFQSRNELAVLLARNGRWDQAKGHLVRSLQVKQTPAAWHNLATVHQNLNEPRLAQAAFSQYDVAKSKVDNGNTDYGVRWVNAEQMEVQGAQLEQSGARLATQVATLPQQVPVPQQTQKKQGWLAPIRKLF